MIHLPHAPFASSDKPSSLFSIWTRSGIAQRQRSRRRLFVGGGLSLLMHGLLLLVTLHQSMDFPKEQSNAAPGPLTIHLVRPATPTLPKIAAAPPKPRPASKPAGNQRALIARPMPAPALPSPPEPAPELAEPMDMTAMLNAARERRHTAEEADARENGAAQADSRQPSPNEIATANIQHSLNMQSGRPNGKGGRFQLLGKGARTGRFSFHGWTVGGTSTPQQTYEVDAGPNGDVERAIVRRMIELIRARFPGDFNWESYRLGRIIVKSARIQHNAELEAFLMKEFFSNDGRMPH